MKIRQWGKAILSQLPWVDAYFRRVIWSRLRFPEAEMSLLHELTGRPFDVAVDVGAAMGGYAWILNRKSRRVFAFEPGKVHADFLSLAMPGTRIELVRSAVGSSEENVIMFTPGSDTNALHSATLSIENPVTQTAATTKAEVQQITLDNFLAANLKPGESFDFLKVDVEGYEQAVFEGAMDQIQKYHPLIFCEIEKRHNANFARTFRLLRDAGYVSYIYLKGEIQRFDGDDIGHFQKEADLRYRLSPDYQSQNGQYVNNFIFEHSKSKVRISQ